MCSQQLLCPVYHSIALSRIAKNMKSQRRSPRSSFVVTGEITDESSRTVISRIRGLNLYGCYIEMANPLPQGTSISVKISAGKAGFQARGRVIYSEPNTGSGVEFQGVEPRYQSILEEWLLEATGMDQIDKGT
jgi:hypothetical protein